MFLKLRIEDLDRYNGWDSETHSLVEKPVFNLDVPTKSKAIACVRLDCFNL